MTSLRHSRQLSERLRRGYTLMEMLLVLAIIVIAAAAVAPSFRGVMRSAALKAAASDVRTALTKAHIQAMKTGRIQVFHYELGGTKYKLEPFISGDDALESPDGDPNGAFAAPSSSHHVTPDKTLPDGTKFAAGDAAIESRSERVEQELSSAGGSGVTWSRPILFYPDGSSVDAFVVVGNDRGVGVRVELRGMTAAVKVGEVSDLRKLEEAQPLSR